jgi:hypothetical protein
MPNFAGARTTVGVLLVVAGVVRWLVRAIPAGTCRDEGASGRLTRA